MHRRLPNGAVRLRAADEDVGPVRAVASGPADVDAVRVCRERGVGEDAELGRRPRRCLPVVDEVRHLHGRGKGRAPVRGA